MSSLSAARRRFALLALALGGFGIGATEFVASGLLPQIASGLLPQVVAASHQQAIAQAGTVISAYAAGVVVGAPTIAMFAARLPRKALLLGAIGVFVLGSVASALAPTIGLLIAARFVAGLPHGAYFGVAALVAADIMGGGRRARGVAMVLMGLTVSNIVGVPAITFLGQLTGWRWAYVAVAGVFLLAAAAVWLAVPGAPGDPHATVRRELGGFRRPGVWITLLSGTIGFGGFFAVESYVAPLTTRVTGLPSEAVPLVLVVGGIGMTVGNLIAGHVADRGTVRTIFICFGAFAVSFTLLALTAANPVGLFAGVFLVMATGSALSPAIQARVMEVAGDSVTLAAATNHAAFNLGNSGGAFLGGAVIAAGWGYVAPTWVGLALCVPGAVLALVSWRMTRSAPDRLERPGGRVLDEDAVLDRALP